jgi:hypothetical protein
MAIPAKPVFAAMSYADPKTGILTAGGQQALAQWQSAINSTQDQLTQLEATVAQLQQQVAALQGKA